MTQQTEMDEVRDPLGQRAVSEFPKRGVSACEPPLVTDTVYFVH